MALFAADLQKRHLEGTPDPFPPDQHSLDFTPIDSARIEAPLTNTVFDTDFQTAFPSLVATSVAPVAPAWGLGPRIKPNIAPSPVFTDSFTLSTIDLSSAGKDGKNATLGEVIKKITGKYRIKVDASANGRARQTTFHMKSDSQKELDKAKRSFLALLSPVITVVINAPASTIASIIGPKGSTLKHIRDQTGVRVDIPKRDFVANGTGHVHGPPYDTVSQVTCDDEEPTIPVTLVGPQPLVYEAQELLNKIILSKTSKVTQRVRDIPVHILPFIVAQKSVFESVAKGSDFNFGLDLSIREVTISGDREAVVRIIELIKATIDDLKSCLESLKITRAKSQHRLIVGKAAEEIMALSNCAVVVPGHDEASDEVTVWGRASDLPAGLSAVMEKASSQYIHEFPLPGNIKTSRQILKYMNYIHLDKTLGAASPKVAVFFPTIAQAERMQSINVDLVGVKADVDAVVRNVSELIGKLFNATRELDIDWLLHRVFVSKHAKKIRQFHEMHNVQIFFPRESAESSTVLLVYDPSSPSASPSLDDKSKHLDDVERSIIALAKDAADVKSQIIAVEKRWHASVVGQSGTTLNAIIGEDKTLSIKVGGEAGDASEDVIFVRGISSDVDRVVKEILQIVENAKNDEIVNSYSAEFDVDKDFVGRIVGSQGSGINKLREQLGVKVDLSDDVADDRDRDLGRKKKSTTPQKCTVKITGRKENVEEAKKRILAQVDRLADETSEVLKIPTQYHSSLIGQNGKYAIRLEEKYSVKITFPRHSSDGEGKTREHLKSDEVLIKGGKKGVAGAKAEILDAVEFEKESNNIIKFSVPTRAISRILGKGGAVINEIKDNTEAQIDIDKTYENEGVNTIIVVRGTKKAIAAAKAAILTISEQVADEVTDSVILEQKFHRTVIGGGGQGLKELISRCGGPSDPRYQAGLVRFPRQEESSDEVVLRGDRALVKKLKAELEKMAATLRDRVIMAIEIPLAQHRMFIGRGGHNLNEIQNKHNVQIQFPGSRSYAQVGECSNADELVGLDANNIVKISGPRSACEAVIVELKSQVKGPAAAAITSTVIVPLKYVASVSQQGNIFRTLRALGVQVDQSIQAQKSGLATSGVPSARIDDQNQNDSTFNFQWEVDANYKDAEEGDSVWTLKARNEVGLEKAEKIVGEAIKHAENMSHVGFLTLNDRSSFPRIVGAKGANVARLRNESGADITVGRESNTIHIVGTEESVNAAKDAIIKLVSAPARQQRRYQD